ADIKITFTTFRVVRLTFEPKVSVCIRSYRLMKVNQYWWMVTAVTSAFLIKIDFIVVLVSHFVKTFFNELAAPMDIDVKVFIKLQHTLENTCCTLHGMR